MPRPRIRVAAILAEDGKILLARHEKDGQTYWVLPGGGVKHGESLADALVREALEETGLAIRVGELVMVNDSIPPDGHRHIVNVYFVAEIEGGNLCLGSDERLAEVRWMPLEELPRLRFYPDVREDLLRGLREGFAHVPRYLGNLWKDN